MGNITLSTLLKITGLSTRFPAPDGTVRAVDSLDLHINEKETLSLVGESGCGKSITAFSIMRLVPPPGMITSGEILFEGQDLLDLPDERMRRIRGNRISMIFQEPMTSLNPVFRIGDQIAEGLRLHRGLSAREARDETVEILRCVGIPSPASRYDDYPHQLSGGMRQRIMIAMALSCKPKLLIADEPTTALDVTIQAQILELIDDLQAEFGMGLLLITHDLGIVAERSNRTAIMYAGRIVETCATRDILKTPCHPYTKGLLASLPQNARPGRPLPVIPGNVPKPGSTISGCDFRDRCPYAESRCATDPPPSREVEEGHSVSCWKFK